MVVDASAVLAIFFDEPEAPWVIDRLNEHAAALCMSTVNVAEVLILLRDRKPKVAAELQDRLLTSGIRFMAPDVNQARIAAEARLRFPLNLGDCFAYALSVAEDCAILAIDRDFRRTDRPVILPDA